MVYSKENMSSEKNLNFDRFGADLKLNIGAGPEIKTPGWLTVDYVDSGWADFGSALPDVSWELTNGIPFHDETVSAIYASHILEHFTWSEGRVFLAECCRVLKPSSPLRIIVPDGDYFIERFYKRDEEFFKDPERCYNHWLGNMTDTFLWNILGAFHSENRSFGCHAMMYNFENMSFRLKELGFISAERQIFGVTNHAEFMDEQKFFPNRVLPRDFSKSSLIVECTKSGL